jgi:serine phosphatase RsbU (regulator of sigma subunit)
MEVTGAPCRRLSETQNGKPLVSGCHAPETWNRWVAPRTPIPSRGAPPFTLYPRIPLRSTARHFGALAVDDAQVGRTLRALDRLAPSDVTASLAQQVRLMGGYDTTIFLIDFEQSALIPVPDRGAHLDSPSGIATVGTLEGRSFVERRFVSQATGGSIRICVPILEGSECTGVLAFTLAGDVDDDVRRHSEELGMLAGAAIAMAARYTDLFNLVRRRKAMSLPASIQWDLLPPLQLKTPEVTSSGVLEPAYDVGGDCFDHSINGSTVDVAIMDAMGHGLASSVVSSLAVASYRHDRREGQPLGVIHERLDGVLADQFRGERFVTGQLARLDGPSGGLAWTNAGHPLPLHVRRGRVLGTLSCRPSRPWGLHGPPAEEAEEALEPGDSVVFYTDGVTEGRQPGGDPFGIDRFVDIIERASASQIPSDVVLRTAVNAVLDYQDRRLRDDATIVWLTWQPGPSAVRPQVD